MTVTITLAPDVKEQIMEQAQAEGFALEEFLPRLIQRALPRTGSTVTLRQGDSDWLAMLHQPPPVAVINPATENALLMISREDLRRENLYEDRS